VRDFQVEILVRGARVLDVEMVLDDTSTEDTIVPIQTARVLRTDVVRGMRGDEAPIEGGQWWRTLIAFHLPLWKPGVNAVTVQVGTSRGWHQERAEFSLLVPEAWGLGDGMRRGLGTFASLSLPMWAEGCSAAFCKDADQDGLLDLWENLASDQPPAALPRG
jgi:hypothetical protein